MSNAFSIHKNASANRETKAKLKYSPKKCYDRFKAKTYFKELDCVNGEHSPGPCAYQTVTSKFPMIRRSSENLFGTADRKLELKKEERDSPSPTKYNVNFEIKNTMNKKGISFGKAPKTFSLHAHIGY